MIERISFILLNGFAYQVYLQVELFCSVCFGSRILCISKSEMNQHPPPHCLEVLNLSEWIVSVSKAFDRIKNILILVYILILKVSLTQDLFW